METCLCKEQSKYDIRISKIKRYKVKLHAIDIYLKTGNKIHPRSCVRLHACQRSRIIHPKTI